MPRPPSEEPLVKVTMKLFHADVEALKRMYGAGGVSDAVRTIIRAHIRTVQAAADDVSFQHDGEEGGEEIDFPVELD